MSLRIILNEHSEAIKASLQRICPEQYLEISWEDEYLVRFNWTLPIALPEAPGVVLLRTLTDDPRKSRRSENGISPCDVRIRGMAPTDTFFNAKSGRIETIAASGGGFTLQIPGLQDLPDEIEVYIDATFCNNQGYRFNEGSAHNLVTRTLDLILVHELNHAVKFQEGIRGNEEDYALNGENEYRDNNFIPRRVDLEPFDSPCLGALWRYQENSPGTLTYHSPQGNVYGTTFEAWIGAAQDPISLDMARNDAGVDFDTRVGMIEVDVAARGDTFVPPDHTNFNVPASFRFPPASNLPSSSDAPATSMSDSGAESGHKNLWKYTELSTRSNINARPTFVAALYYRYPGQPEVSASHNNTAGDQGEAHSSPIPYGNAKWRPWWDDLLQGIRTQLGPDDTYEAPSGTNWDPPDSYFEDAPFIKFGCIVAESHPAGRDADVLNELRRYRDKFLRETRWGAALFDRFHRSYYSFSGDVAEQIKADPEMRASVGFMIAAPLINYLRIAAHLPRFEPSDLDGVPAPFRDFLKMISADLDGWLKNIDVGSEIRGLGCEGAAIEIAVALRFRFRTAQARDVYLSELERDGLLPLSGTDVEMSSAASAMRALGASEDILRRALGRRPALGE